eukprot:911241_1
MATSCCCVMWWDMRNYILRWELPLIYQFIEFGIGAIFIGTIVATIWLLIELFIVSDVESFFNDLISRPLAPIVFSLTIIGMITSWSIFVALLKPYREQKVHIKMLRKEVLKLQIKQKNIHFENKLTDEDIQKASEIMMEKGLELDLQIDCNVNTTHKSREIMVYSIHESKELIALIDLLQSVIAFCEEHPACATVLGTQLSGDSLKVFQG